MCAYRFFFTRIRHSMRINLGALYRDALMLVVSTCLVVIFSHIDRQ